MPATEFSLQNDFPPVDYDQWKALAEADLKGASFEQKLVTHSYEGIDLQPLYTRRDQVGEGDAAGFPGAPPFVRGSTTLGAVQTGWDLRQEHTHPDLAVTNAAILEDLAGGVTSLLLRLDHAARDGIEIDNPLAAELAGRDGLMVYNIDDLDAALAGVHLNMVAIALDAGAAFLPAAAVLAALWKRRNIASDQVRGAFNADPLAVLAREGRLPTSPRSALAQVADMAVWTSQHYPHLTAVGVNTGPYHHAGATAAQDIALAVATGLEYLRAMTAAGMNLDAAAKQILFNLSLGTHHFLAIAKLRAARKLWSRIIEACGGSPAAGAMQISARTSRRVLTQRDPYVNLLRNTVAVFAAGLGGAQSITSAPLDAVIGPPSSFSRRIARNTSLILQEEAHLNRVIDPAGGSWYLETLTQQIAEKAWSIFQDTERHGGMLTALKAGWVAEQIQSAFAPRAKDIARRKEGITGVSEFPDIREERVQAAAIDIPALRASAKTRLASTQKDHRSLAGLVNQSARMGVATEAALDGATIGQIARALAFHKEPFEILPLELRSFAEPFESLRNASDQWEAKHGRRPTVFLANLGPVSHHTARAMYSKNFFAAGGFDCIGNDGFKDADAAVAAFRQSGATVAVICSSDKLYPELVPQVAPKLKAAGAKTVVLAGNPGGNEEAWRAAGVDRFIFIKCDVLASLREILVAEGVMQEGR